MLKADPGICAKCLVELDYRVCNEKVVPEAGQEGIILQLPKKGDLTACGNWREINLLSVPVKTFCRDFLR